VYWEKLKSHIGYIRLLIRDYKEETLLTSELVEFKGHLPIYAPSPNSSGREGVYWEKPKSHVG